MSQRKTLKKFALLLVSALSIFILAACSSSDKVPYGSFNPTDEYLKINNKTVSKRDLVNKLRYQASDLLLIDFEKAVFAKELSNINFKGEDKKDVIAIEKSINSAIFGQTDIATIAKISEVSRSKSIIKYVDNLVLTDPSLIVVKDTLISEISNKVDEAVAEFNKNADDFDKAKLVFGYSENLLKKYELNYAKRLYAIKQLEALQVTEKDKSKKDSNFITEESLVEKYNSSYKGKFDEISALIIKFDNEKESEIARHTHSLKSNSQGEWYTLPEVQDIKTFEKIQTSPDSDLSKAELEAKRIIKDKNLKPTKGAILVGTEAYTTFYNSYTFSQDRDGEFVLSNEKVLEIFKTIYEELNSTVKLPSDKDELTKKLTYKYDNPIISNSDLRNALKTLKASKDSTDGNTTVKPYSKSVSSYGGNRYLLYFLDIKEDKESDIIIKNSDDKEVFADTDLAKKYRQKIYNEVFESKLTADYINKQTSDLLKDSKISIYDPIVKTLFDFTTSHSSKGGYVDNDTLAKLSLTRKIDDAEVKVDLIINYDAFFNEVEKVYGLSVAVEEVLSQVLRDKYSVSDEKRKELEGTFKSVLENFANNGLANSGYPKSMGQDAFLMAAFNATSNKEAFENAYILGNLRTQYQEDLDGKYENAKIYEKFADFTNKSYSQNKGVKVSHLLISIDLDGDGALDDPKDLPKDSPILALVDGKDAITNLTELLLELAETKYSSLTTGLSSVVTLYNNATRYELLKNGLLDYEIVNKFVAFRQLGLKAQYEDLNTITNETNYPTSTSQLDSTFYTYVMDTLLDEVKDFEKSEFPHLSNTPRTIGQSNSPLKGLQTAFGWHTLIATDSYTAKSAKLDAEALSKFKNPTKPDQVLNAKNENDTLTYEQIAIYLKESTVPTGVETLTNDVKAAITAYFEPVYKKFISSSMTSYTSLRTAFGNSEFKVNDSGLQARIDALLEISRNQFFEYSIFDDARTNGVYTKASEGNKDFKEVYGSWFTTFR